MERKEKVDIIQQAIKQLMEDENADEVPRLFSSSSDENFVAVDVENSGGDNSHRRRQLLSKLLSELESLEGEENCRSELKEETNITEEKQSSIADEKIGNSEEIIIKELKNLKRQNLITHCLLSAMIVITLAWQLSEVSLILKIKDGLSNPLKSVGGMVGGFLKGGRRRAETELQEAVKQASAKQKQVIECTSLPGLRIRELPHLDLPGFDTSEED